MKKGKDNFEVSISKEELALLPTEKFEGEIIVIDNLSSIGKVVEELRASPIVGFDTETKPAFRKGQINQVALLQLATINKSYLIRISKIGFPSQIKEFLEDASYLKVGLSVKDDFHSLSKLGPFHPSGFIDLQEFVKEFKISDCSLTKIHGIVFGTRISKNQQLTNWEASVLTRKQQEYAALDALACVNIYRRLKSGEFDSESSSYYKEKCTEKE